MYIEERDENTYTHTRLKYTGYGNQRNAYSLHTTFATLLLTSATQLQKSCPIFGFIGSSDRITIHRGVGIKKTPVLHSDRLRAHSVLLFCLTLLPASSSHVFSAAIYRSRKPLTQRANLQKQHCHLISFSPFWNMHCCRNTAKSVDAGGSNFVRKGESTRCFSPNLERAIQSAEPILEIGFSTLGGICKIQAQFHS